MNSLTMVRTVPSFLISCLFWYAFAYFLGLSPLFILIVSAFLLAKEVAYYYVARLYNVEVSAPFFTPISALNYRKEKTNLSIADESNAELITQGAGLVLVLLLFALAVSQFGNPDIRAALLTCTAISQLCLIPMPPLPGGMILLPLSVQVRWFGFLALVLIVTFVPWVTYNPVLFLFTAFLYGLGIIEGANRLEERRTNASYYQVDINQKLTCAALYLLLLFTQLTI